MSLFYLSISAIYMIFIDYIWLSFVMKDLYIRYLNHTIHVNNGSINVALGPAVCVYILIFFSTFYFAIIPSKNKPLLKGAINGYLIGICTYGCYDLTNLALIPKWNLGVAILDTLWGGFLCSTTAILYLSLEKFYKRS